MIPSRPIRFCHVFMLGYLLFIQVVTVFVGDDFLNFFYSWCTLLIRSRLKILSASTTAALPGVIWIGYPIWRKIVYLNHPKIRVFKKWSIESFEYSKSRRRILCLLATLFVYLLTRERPEAYAGTAKANRIGRISTLHLVYKYVSFCQLVKWNE